MTVHSDPRWRWRKLRWWLGYAVGCALFAAAVWGTESARRRHAAGEADYQRTSAAIVSTIRQRVRPGYDRADAARALNGGQPLRHVDQVGNTSLLQMPADRIGAEFRGWAVRFRVRNDWITAVHVSGPPRVPYRGPSQNWVRMERTRQGVIVFGAGAWCVGLITMPFAGPWRRDVAQVCLAAVLAAAVAWAVYPFRTWDRADLVAPLPIALLAVGLLTLIPAQWPGPPAAGGSRAGACPGCGYDLTGNESGVCPECGRPTWRGRADRWREEAERIGAVRAEAPTLDEADAVAPAWGGRK